VFLKKHSDCRWLMIERLSFAASSMWSAIVLVKTAAKFSSEGYWPTCSICLTYLSFVKHRTPNHHHTWDIIKRQLYVVYMMWIF